MAQNQKNQSSKLTKGERSSPILNNVGISNPSFSHKLQSSEDGHVHKHIQYAPKECMTLEGYPVITGFNFESCTRDGVIDFGAFLNAYASTGFQATHLASAIETIKAMRREKAVIFLAYTSNMVSSGVRDIICYLVKHKLVDVLITSAGGIEEDVIKTLKPFVLGQFEAPGRMLFENGVNRTGNIFVPNDRFAYFEQYMQPLFEKVLEMQISSGKVLCPSDFIYELGQYVSDQKSILYWASRNSIPVFCPGIIDGSLGDLMYFFKQSHPQFMIDVTLEMKKIVDLVLNSEKTGGIILGGGISKHFALNTNIFKEGFDFVVYVNTAQEFDGSDSGARIEEAITWGKVKPDAVAVKVHCDATIAFPLIVAGAFLIPGSMKKSSDNAETEEEER